MLGSAYVQVRRRSGSDLPVSRIDPPQIPGAVVRARAARGVTRLLVEREASRDESKKEPTESEERINSLFEELGGTGKIKVYEYLDGHDAYLFQIDATDTATDNIEEYLRERLGGGKYRLKGYHGSRHCVASATLVIAGPKKEHAAAKAAGAERDPRLEKELEESRARQRDLEAENRRLERDSLKSLLTFVVESNRETTKLLVETLKHRNDAPAAPAAPVDALGQVEKVVGVAKKLQELAPPAGSGGGNDAPRSMLERVTETPLTKMGERLVDRLLADESKPPPAAPAGARLPAPEATAKPQLPNGAKRMSREEVNTYRQARASAPAPKASDVLPTTEKNPAA